MKRLIPPSHFTTRDPYVMKHNGKFYRCFTRTCSDLYVSEADTIEGLELAEEKLVFVPEDGAFWSSQYWAPELHVIDGKCYIYFACDDGDNHNHRMYVVENNSNNPTDPYVMHGKITDSTDKWAIDGTILYHDGKRYFVWVGWEGDRNICQNLYIARMNSPYTIDSERVMISTPEYDFEKHGSTGMDESPFINEGPFPVYVNGETYLLYSGSGCWCTDYCIAQLKLVGSDPMDPASWEKLDHPIFSSNDVVKGAGHPSVVNDNGKNYIFFHAWDKDEETIALNTVSTWMAELKYTENGFVIE